MRDQSKPRLMEQPLIFFGIKARMIERFSVIAAQAFPLLWTCIEQEESARGGVSGEHREHGPLVIRCEVEEAVPTEKPIKALRKRDRLHLCDDPLVLWHALAAQGDERWRCVHTRHTQAMLDKMQRNGHS